MIVEQLRWLRDKLALSTATEEQEWSEYITSAYTDQLDTIADAGEVFLKSIDYARLPQLLLSSRCPIQDPDPTKFGYPLPPGLQADRCAKPLETHGQSLAGGKPKHIKMDVPESPHTQHLPDIVPGPYDDLGAARSFQLTDIGRKVGLEEWSHITMAYRGNVEQREEDRRVAQKKKAETLVGELKIMNGLELEAMETWLHDGGSLGTGSGNVPASHEDLMLLKGTGQDGNWVNDNVVNRFMQVIQAQASKKVAVISSQITEALRGGKDARRWGRNVGLDNDSIRLFDAIVVPWCTGDHWILFVAEPQEQRVSIWDSLGEPAAYEQDLRLLTRWLEQKLDVEWTSRCMKSPRQRDGDGCGVILCYNAALYMLKQAVSKMDAASVAQMQDMRDWLSFSLMKGKVQAEHLSRLK